MEIQEIFLCQDLNTIKGRAIDVSLNLLHNGRFFMFKNWQKFTSIHSEKYLHLFKSCVFSTSRYDDQWMICSVWTCELPSLMLSKIIKLQQCRAVSVSVRSQRNKQIKSSLSSAELLTFHFLGFENEEKEKIFPLKIIITTPSLPPPWFRRRLVFFLHQIFAVGLTLS